ncbi:MAG TPA: nitrite reductase large subunit NirB [Kofleriaceae bacterium]|nr:nitrite reductase large subunit NirB [Kofleriaceae bacterium]
MSERRQLAVVGNGMVGHRFLEELADAGGLASWDVVVFGEERRLAYDRVHLSTYFAGASAGDLALGTAEDYDRLGIRVITGDPVVELDPGAQLVHSSKGRTIAYDAVVLATGSAPFVPPIRGADGPGCHVYRTLDDLDEIRRSGTGRTRGAVIGGGLLGLEAANALVNMGLETHVIELSSHLMATQLDEPGGELLACRVRELGIHVHTSRRTVEILHGPRGPERVRFGEGDELEVDLVVFSAGIRPRDQLARAAGLACGARGGVAIDELCRTSAPSVYAIGECVSWNGRSYGLVAPGYRMARVAARHLSGDRETRLTSIEPATELKLLGVDVASFGDGHGASEGALSFSIADQVQQRYKKLVFSADKRRLIGAVFVGDTAAYRGLLGLWQSGAPLPDNPESLLLAPAVATAAQAVGGFAGPVCTCNDVSAESVCAAIRAGARDLACLKRETRAGSGCGGCAPTLKALLDTELTALGVEVSNRLCEHFAFSRQDLYNLVRVKQIRSFDALLSQYGRGRGCEVCKPAVTSILAACWNEHVLAPAHAPLQDSNDYFLANIQRDGTYSVVPRVPGGEITPDKVIAIGTIAKRYDLYTKITGGQRIDLFGARVDELPAIWRELIDAGFESGHAYGKAMRTVKSCVGSTWCRYGVQDSVSLAIALEQRYRGLRAPHKLKLGVSGCTRECAEAQSKDVGVIATEKGYNLYVCGNGGARPRHADLFAVDLDEPTLVRYIDRFLMFYIRTADRLQRTARWLEGLEGGLSYLREVVIEDKLGIAADLEAEMTHVVSTYQCEWRAVLENPLTLSRFRSFVNDPSSDDTLVFVRERGQRRPARPEEIAAQQAEEAAR